MAQCRFTIALAFPKDAKIEIIQTLYFSAMHSSQKGSFFHGKLRFVCFLESNIFQSFIPKWAKKKQESKILEALDQNKKYYELFPCSSIGLIDMFTNVTYQCC